MANPQGRYILELFIWLAVVMVGIVLFDHFEQQLFSYLWTGGGVLGFLVIASRLERTQKRHEQEPMALAVQEWERWEADDLNLPPNPPNAESMAGS
jgi:positive regulator of sigma E activity